MQCPIDKVDLVMSERHGIEIDYCPKCRGVWLDRGELDKIIERAAEPASVREPEPAAREYAPAPKYEDRHHRPHYKKRKSFLDDIFDF
jgi:Zn-finger nucleic acid-binding protein